MNKQEAIEKIYTASWNDGYHEGLLVDVETVNKIIYQIAEPQKVVVPKFVAEWYEKNNYNINTAICNAIIKSYRKVNGENDDSLDTFEAWLVYEYNSISILVQMKLFGYETEKEKLYTVEIPNPNSAGGKLVLFKQQSSGRLILDMLNPNINKPKYLHLTEAEIKEDFEWAFQFAKPVEEK